MLMLNTLLVKITKEFSMLSWSVIVIYTNNGLNGLFVR